MADVFIISITSISFFMTFSIGSNDASNALFSSYGSNAFKLNMILTAGAIFVFLGAYYCSGRVASTLIPTMLAGIGEESKLL
jgi:phosphate/sulfate permease